MYEIPTNVKDLDDLANAWSLSPAEFNAIKGIYGASRIRQGLTARHKASEADLIRDFHKAIHYTKKMLDFHNLNESLKIKRPEDHKPPSRAVGPGVRGAM